MKTKLLRAFVVLLFLITNIIFIFLLANILDWLSITATRQFSRVHLLAISFLFTLGVSLLFSLNHIKGLFFQKIKIQIANLVVAVVLGLTLLTTFFLPVAFLAVFTVLWQFIPSTHFSINIVYFVFWYNLIYSFRVKPPENKE